MKAKIDGRFYNTETATMICEIERTHNTAYFKWELTTLYRSPRGRYFIAGKGGPLSRWGRPQGSNGRAGGSGLELVSGLEAQDLAERAGLTHDEMVAAGFEIEEG